MKQKQYNITKISNITHDLFKTQQPQIHSVFKHTLNIIVGDELIALSCNSSFQKHVIIVEKIDFISAGIKQNSQISVKENSIIIDQFNFFYSSEIIIKEKHDDVIIEVSANLDDTIYDLENWLKNEPPIHFYNYPNNKIYQYQFAQIDTFILDKSFENAKKLIGLGVGLTPIGDDVLTGYIFAKNVLNERVPYIYQLIKIAKIKTNRISFQYLKDTVQQDYSEMFLRIKNELFVENKLDAIKELSDFGSTSGKAIITGIIIACKDRSDKYETV